MPHGDEFAGPSARTAGKTRGVPRSGIGRCAGDGSPGRRALAGPCRHMGAGAATGMGKRRVPRSMLYRAKARLQSLGVPVLPRLAHRLAMAMAQVSIGDPVVVQPGLYLLHGQVVIDGLVEIGGDTVIGPFVTIGLIAGDLVGPTIGRGVRIGTGARILGPLQVGAGAVIGAIPSSCRTYPRVPPRRACPPASLHRRPTCRGYVQRRVATIRPSACSPTCCRSPCGVRQACWRLDDRSSFKRTQKVLAYADAGPRSHEARRSRVEMVLPKPLGKEERGVVETCELIDEDIAT